MSIAADTSSWNWTRNKTSADAIVNSSLIVFIQGKLIGPYWEWSMSNNLESYQSWLKMANSVEFAHLLQCWEWSGGKPTGGPCQHWRCTRCFRVIPLHPLLFGDAIPVYQFQPLPQLCSQCDLLELRDRARAAKNRRPKRHWASMARQNPAPKVRLRY